MQQMRERVYHERSRRMRKKEYWITWAKAAGVRAIKTVAQTAIATIGTTTAMGAVNWGMVGSTAALAGILSVLTSVAGLPEVTEE